MGMPDRGAGGAFSAAICVRFRKKSRKIGSQKWLCRENPPRQWKIALNRIAPPDTLTISPSFLLLEFLPIFYVVVEAALFDTRVRHRRLRAVYPSATPTCKSLRAAHPPDPLTPPPRPEKESAFRARFSSFSRPEARQCAISQSSDLQMPETYSLSQPLSLKSPVSTLFPLFPSSVLSRSLCFHRQVML